MANRQIYATGSILDDKRKFQILKSVMGPRSLDGCKTYTTALDTPAASVVGRYPKRLKSTQISYALVLSVRSGKGERDGRRKTGISARHVPWGHLLG